MFGDGDFKRDRPYLSYIQELQKQMLVGYNPEYGIGAYVGEDGLIRYRRAEPNSILELARNKSESYQNLRERVLSSQKPGRPCFTPLDNKDCKEFKPWFVPWWECKAPATIKDSQFNIRIKRKKIKFNFNN